MNRFLVTWRSRVTGRTHPVGLLLTRAQTFTFSYLPGIHEIQGFRLFVNFPDAAREYHSERLFPFFSQRVMDSRRPDFPAYVAALGLSSDPSPLAVLGRASGQRKGDTVQVILEPRIAADGSIDHTFLLSGAKYAPGDPLAVIGQLRRGTSLLARPQPDNNVNSQAHLICTAEGAPIGWVPDALLDTVQAAVTNPHQLTATQVNGPEWPSYMRVIVRLQGSVPPSFQPFTALSGRVPEPVVVASR